MGNDLIDKFMATRIDNAPEVLARWGIRGLLDEFSSFILVEMNDWCDTSFESIEDAISSVNLSKQKETPC